jgi:hypothetical protein
MADALRGSMDAAEYKLVSGELRVRDAERFIAGNQRLQYSGS